MKTTAVYARYEPTDDALLVGKKLTSRHRDVQIYLDEAATKPYARFPWYRSKPDRRSKYVSLNCYRHQLRWLPELVN